MTATRIGAQLRKHRKNRKLTLAEVGDLVGVTVAHLSDIELGKRMPSKVLFLELSEVGLIPPQERALELVKLDLVDAWWSRGGGT